MPVGSASVGFARGLSPHASGQSGHLVSTLKAARRGGRTKAQPLCGAGASWELAAQTKMAVLSADPAHLRGDPSASSLSCSRWEIL